MSTKGFVSVKAAAAQASGAAKGGEAGTAKCAAVELVARPFPWLVLGAALSLVVAVVAGKQGLFASNVARSPADVSPGGGTQDIVPDGLHRTRYVEGARRALVQYVSNPGSKITVKGSREQVLAQIGGLSDSRALEEYAKILCVQGRGSEAARALSTQLDIFESGTVATGDPSGALVKIRLAQAFFTQGRLARVRELLQGVLSGDALHAAPQWWGHLQWRLALRWSDDPLDIGNAGLVLVNICMDLRRRLDATHIGLEGGPCGGPASLGRLEVPSATAAALRDLSLGYGVWRGVLPSTVVEHLRRHYLLLLDRDLQGGGGNDARQHRHGWHNEPVAGYFHYLVAEAMREMDVELVPTYVFSLVYLEAGQLFPHLDRPDNEVSLTVSLGSDPPGYIWPLTMRGEQFDLQPGDAVLYRGAEVKHAREPLPVGHRSLQVIFGFRRKCAECCHLV